MDLSFLTSAATWINLVLLIFLEIALGIDNLVFITITTDRLPEDKQRLGRRLGLAGALVMRIILLCFASWLVSMTEALFTIDLGFYEHGFSLRDIILFVGGIYLIYKGIDELRNLFHDLHSDEDEKEEKKSSREITLPRAVVTIMIMDVAFSIDTVITAVALANHLVVMIAAVIIAVIFMMLFIDYVAKFLNSHFEIKVLALGFISVIGVLLVLDSLGITTGIVILEIQLEKLIVYIVMVIALIAVLIYIYVRGKKQLPK